MALIPVLSEAKEKFRTIVTEHQLSGEAVRVNIGQLSAEQAIGTPKRKDFALLEGKEVIIEARFRDSFGHAFTSQPEEFEGTLDDVLHLALDTDSQRAIFVSTLNAVMAYLGLTTGVRHCRDDEPEKCGAYIARNLRERFGPISVGLVGLQPAILENLVNVFGSGHVRCSDLNPENIGTEKYSVEIWDGKTRNLELVKWSHLVLVTSSAIVNNTLDEIRREVIREGKHLIIFGVSGAGISTLLGLERICPFGH